MSQEFQTENGDRYIVEGPVLEVWSWTGQSQARIRLDLLDSIEYKGKWGTHLISLKKSSHSYSITDAGNQAEELVAWLNSTKASLGG